MTMQGHAGTSRPRLSGWVKLDSGCPTLVAMGAREPARSGCGESRGWDFDLPSAESHLNPSL
jgi:hypothetical protein